MFFLSGIQIDRYGNINLHVLGDYSSPQMRLPGAYGSAMLYYMAHRVILFRTEQELSVLRTVVRQKLERIYPEFARTKIRPD